MVSVLSTADQPTPPKTRFPYLKPCQPAPGIVVPAAHSPEPRLGKWQRRWLALSFATAQGMALALGAWVPSLLSREPEGIPVAAQTVEQQVQNELWETLGSEKLAQILLAAKEKQLDAQLAAAAQVRQQAQVQADAHMREVAATAMEQAEVIRLDATYIGAEQVIYADPGDAVTLKFAARIQCEAGAFGQTAMVTPRDPRIAARVVRNLGDCFPSAMAAAGAPIGEAGEWGVAFFKQTE